MGGGSSKAEARNAFVFLEHIVSGDEHDAIGFLDGKNALKVLHKANKGKVPFIEACRYGRLGVVKKMMENHDKGIQQIDTASLSHGLRMNIRNRTSQGICRMLIDRGASIEDRDEDMLTPMMACVYKEGVEPEIIAARLATLQLVIERGAKFETELTSGVTALCLACQNYFERAAHLLAERGARLQALSKWMKEPMNKNNWCSGSTFGKYIWETVQSLEKNTLHPSKKNSTKSLIRMVAAHSRGMRWSHS